MNTVALCTTCGERVTFHETRYGRFALCPTHHVRRDSEVTIRPRRWLVARQIVRALFWATTVAVLAFTVWAFAVVLIIDLTTN